jgi:hypothetical protein
MHERGKYGEKNKAVEEVALSTMPMERDVEFRFHDLPMLVIYDRGL